MLLTDFELAPPLVGTPLIGEVGPPRPASDIPAVPVPIKVLLQVGHRLATVALLAVLATGYLAFSGREFYTALSASTGCAIVGFSMAILPLSFVRRDQPAWREATGLAAVNGVVAVLGVMMMLVARAGVIQDAVREGGTSVRAQVQDFFTAPPVLPPQP